MSRSVIPIAREGTAEGVFRIEGWGLRCSVDMVSRFPEGRGVIRHTRETDRGGTRSLKLESSRPCLPRQELKQLSQTLWNC